MALTLDSAVAVLEHSAAQRQADERSAQRLSDIQALLGRDLAHIEQILAESVECGPAPATQAAKHLVGLGGKRIRPTALLLSTACFGEVTQAARELAAVVELVHSATLLHDDVVDEGMERRGAVTARRLWGNGISVLSGDLLLIAALEKTAGLGLELLPDLIATLRALVEGEIIQLRGRAELDVSETTYTQILTKKTASLFAWATRTGARVGGASEVDQNKLSEFGELLGIAFQLVDDALDYAGEHTGKTLCADLAEGKMTLPLVLAVAKDPSLVEPLRRVHAGDKDMVRPLSEAVVGSGACDEVRRRASEYTERAVDALRCIAPTPARRLLLEVAEQLAQRGV